MENITATTAYRVFCYCKGAGMGLDSSDRCLLCGFQWIADHDHEPDGWLAFGVGCTQPGCDATVVNVEGPFDDVLIEWSE